MENKTFRLNTVSQRASNVDKKTRTIRNVSVCTSGEALGHGFWTDEEFVNKVAEQINAAGRVKSMFGHGGMCSETLGNEIGWFQDARAEINAELSAELGYEVWQCYADFYATAVTPKNRDLLDHIFILAKKDPRIIGTSIVFTPGDPKTDENGDEYINNSLGLPHETIQKLWRCDFVSDPANNPRGVFSRLFKNNTQNSMNTTKTQKSGAIATLLKDIAKEFTRSNDLREQRSKSAGNAPPAARPPAKKTGAVSVTGPGGIRRRFYADIDLGPENGYLRTTTDVPAVGDPVDYVRPDGEILSPADDGDYTAVDGTIYRVSGGVIEEIMAPEMEGGTDAPPTDPALARQLSDQAKQIARLEKLLADGKNQETTAKKPVNNHRRQNNSSELGMVVDGVRLLAEAKRNANRPKSQQTDAHFTNPRMGYHVGSLGGIPMYAGGPKGFARGTGVDFGETLDHCARYLPELFYEKIIVESLQKQFNMIPIEEKLGGDSVVTKKIPIISDSSGAGYEYGGGGRYIKKGIGCNYLDDGQTNFSQRTITTNPWHVYREYCPREWGNFLDAMVYVNDQELPFQSVIIALFLDSILREWEDDLLNADGIGDSPFQGLLYQFQNDPKIPTAQVLTPYNVTAGNAVAQFEQLFDKVPKTMSGRTDMKWFMPVDDMDLYAVNYRSLFGALPYNNQFEKTWIDRKRFTGEFVQSIHMPQEAGKIRQFIIPATDLWIIMGNMPVIESGYRAREGDLWFKVEAHTGVGYPISQNVTLAIQ